MGASDVRDGAVRREGGGIGVPGGRVAPYGDAMTTSEHRPRPENLPKAEFAFPGPLRDQLVAAILDGSKTSTSGLAIEYEQEGEPLPEVGGRSVVVDSGDRPVGIIEVTGVQVVPLAEVDLAHALDEGEGYADVAAWRAGHERFWHSAGMRAALDDPGFTVDDSTPVVLERFRLVGDLRA
ncbi:uncharacterized protein YhfF [Streptomyces turgidiscabies]|uniref:Uncharacterized protein YhfF n=2 Tax=Streptomyces turgidiscabies TaxID=85558 RepID=A0ABU0RM43_9ACTN|nr:uncharacterized protein YhfF [Streptomyces turgidiscabies]